MPAMLADRVFLGWDEPALPAAVVWLVEHFIHDHVLDLSDVAVVSPGSRAGRRLIERLVGHCRSAQLDLIPPRTLTAQSLAEQLAGRPPSGGILATDAEQRLAWCAVLQTMSAADRATLVPITPDPTVTAGWLKLAAMMQSLWLELAAAQLDFGAVADRVAGQISAAELARWQVLAALEKTYHDRLDQAGRIDPQAWRQHVISEATIAGPATIVMLGTADLSPQLRAMLDLTDAQVRPLVAAPASVADRFDAMGCILPPRWADAPIALDEQKIHVVDQPFDQAITALRQIESWQGAYGADQITVGCVDPDLGDVLIHWFGAYGVPLRDPMGRATAQTAPMQLLAAIDRCLADRSFVAFAALLRHPDLGRWLTRKHPDIAGDSELWLDMADRYQAEHLQARLHADWLGRDSRAKRLAQVYRVIHDDLLGPLSAKQKLSQWSEPIVELLRRVYGGRTLNRNAPRDRQVIEACHQIANLAADLQDLPESLNPALSGDQALGIVLQMLAGQSIAPSSASSAVELLGWLELPLDDAPAMLVTGFNEPHVPQALTADPFLPEGLRRIINESLEDDRWIADNARRYARDAYALNAIAHSHQSFDIIAGQRGPEGDPLSPSRLLLADTPQVIARRVSQWCDEPRAAEPAQMPSAYAHADRPAIALPPQPTIVLADPIRSMRVTDFKAFLDDPYRFALSRGLGLEGVDDHVHEMDALAFGGLAHDVFEKFGRSDVKHAADARAIEQMLLDTLHTLAASRYGAHVHPAVRLQLRQLELRLRQFARWQADSVADGWRIVEVELAFDGVDRPAGRLLVDDSPMGLRGKIDRVDLHDATGVWRVMDYKTSNKPQTPEQTHRKGKTDKRWVDLQLPLYRKLIDAWLDDAGQSVIPQGAAVEVGYVLLPRQVEGFETWAKAPWKDGQIAEAIAVAEDVVRQVRANRFEYDPAARVSFDDYADLVGAALLVGESDDSGEGAGDD